MILLLFAKSAALGLAVAAPVGPMSLLCMRRTLDQGWRAGAATGLGVALGDAAYAAMAALGLAGLSAWLVAHQGPLQAAAGLVLVYLGLRTLLRRPATAAAPEPEAGGFRATGGAFLLTLANPPTIVMFAALFTALAPAVGFGAVAAVTTTVGVFAGSLLWWGGVIAGVSMARRGLGPGVRLWIDRLSGAVLVAFGAVQLAQAF
jgi:threonine/homoserine/homoserine lactone efflux protein